MPRRQLSIKDAIKQSPGTIQKKEIPTEIRESMKYVRKRYEFNIDQIAKRYANASSGLVFNVKDEKVEFDPDLCMAANDEEVLENVKKELHKHTIDSYGASAFLSTPCQDPNEKDAANLDGWKKLNELYDVYLKTGIKEEEDAKDPPMLALARQPLRPTRKRGFTYESAAQNNLNKMARQQQHKFIHYPDAYHPNALFPSIIKKGSVAESHTIDEPIILPLLPTFRAPRQGARRSPMTRQRMKMLQIEQQYDKRDDVIYAENADWIERWINNNNASIKKAN